TDLVQWHDRWQPLTTVEAALKTANVDPTTLPHVSASFDLIALLVIVLVTTILVVGIKESANVNTALVLIKVSIVLLFSGIAGTALSKEGWVSAKKNWDPFIPPNTGVFGQYGWSGVLRGSAVIFFAYIGFDAVSTAAQEAKRPQRDMPVGILGSL